MRSPSAAANGDPTCRLLQSAASVTNLAAQLAPVALISIGPQTSRNLAGSWLRPGDAEAEIPTTSAVWVQACQSASWRRPLLRATPD